MATGAASTGASDIWERIEGILSRWSQTLISGSRSPNGFQIEKAFQYFRTRLQKFTGQPERKMGLQ
jgi:pyrroloquinoline quinone (PQQ) biosynthesis protein C